MSNLLVLENITFAYKEKTVLSIRELSISSPGITAITGSNGSGKTTLLKIIGGLLSPVTGTIRYKGSPIKGEEKEQLQKMCVLVHQTPYLFSGTVKKNIQMGMRSAGIRGMELSLKTQELLEKFSLSKLGMEKAALLSGGEKHKVALARAVGLDRKIILLDEPETHIDAASRKIIEQVLIDLSKKRNIIFTTHDAGIADRLAHTIIHLQDGCIEGEKTYDQI